MKFLDFFAGIGGFRLGMEMAGHECVGHIEIDKYAHKSYVAMHQPKESEFYADDIRNVRAEDLPDADIYCGGFPCQAFSIAGKRGGFEDTRGTLFFEIMRLAKVQKPKYLFLENVRGLLSHDGGRTFGTILQTMAECGYDAEWQVCNSKDYGVPQNRERVFVIGHLRGSGGGQVFPIGGSNSKTLNQLIGGAQGNRVYGADGISCTLASQAGGQGAKTGLYFIDQSNTKSKITENSRCITSRYTAGNVNRTATNSAVLEVRAVITPEREDKRQNGRRMKNADEPMFTLTSQDRHGVAIKEATKKGYTEAEIGDSINISVPNSKTRRGRVGKGISNTLDTGCQMATLDKHYRIRRLTPKECFRLQGFPDELFEKARAVNSDSQLYKQAGNSVTVNVIYEIAKKLR